MITLLISLKLILYTRFGVYCEIYPSHKGNIERVKSQYSFFYNDILLHIHVNLGTRNYCIRIYIYI